MLYYQNKENIELKLKKNENISTLLLNGSLENVNINVKQIGCPRSISSKAINK